MIRNKASTLLKLVSVDDDGDIVSSSAKISNSIARASAQMKLDTSKYKTRISFENAASDVNLTLLQLLRHLTLNLPCQHV